MIRARRAPKSIPWEERAVDWSLLGSVQVRQRLEFGSGRVFFGRIN
jgi:hypothetical protein